MKKRFFSAIAILLIAVCAVTPVKADAASGLLIAPNPNSKASEFMFVADTDNKAYTVTYENVANTTEQTDHALYEYYGYIAPKPLDVSKSAMIKITFDVPVAGQYDVGVVYTALQGTSARKIGIAANKTTALKQVELDTAADWDEMKYYTFKCNLKEGTNTLVIASSADYDNKAVKVPNIYAVKTTLLEEEKNTTEVEPMADKNTKPSGSTPKTGEDTLPIVVCSVSIVALLASMILKKKNI